MSEREIEEARQAGAYLKINPDVESGTWVEDFYRWLASQLEGGRS